ncbi:MAG: hypothetical protein WD737_02590 [Gemmatimonadota bacterium]
MLRLLISTAFLILGSGCSDVPAMQSNQAECVVADLQPERQSPSDAVATLQDTIVLSRRNAIIAAAERVAPAVVSVNVVRRERVVRRSLSSGTGGW